MTPLYVCVGCSSGHFRHAPREGSTVAWHKSVFDRNTSWSAVLASKLAPSTPMRSVIDVGCGIGTWLRFLEQRGSRVLGFDTSAECIEYGRKTFGIDLRHELFAADHPAALKAKADLVTCIMVMEHLSEPRHLARQIAGYCNSVGAKAFVSVPFFNNKAHLHFDSESADHNVFNDVGAHVTYFSDEGMAQMFARVGMKASAKIDGLAWRGFVFEPSGSSARLR